MMFHNVSRLVKTQISAPIGASATALQAKTAVIGNNAILIGDNATGTGDNDARIGDNAMKVIPS